MSNRRKREEFSKKIIKIVLAFSIITIFWGMILASCGKDIPTEVMVSIVAGLFGDITVYSVKAYFGKKKEEETRLLEKKMEEEI